MLWLTALSLLLLVQPSVQVTSNFVTYIPGDAASTVIISAPHGGRKKVSATGIASRPTQGCYDAANDACIYDRYRKRKLCKKVIGKCNVNKKADTNTIKLANDLAKKIAQVSGVRPYIIIGLAHRKVVDLNRDRPEATFENPCALRVWDQYHQYIDQAKASALAGNRNVLYIDVHGQAKDSWNMIGMLLGKDSGLELDPIPESLASQSSITNLHQNSEMLLEELVRGETSIGGLMSSDKYDMVPSPQYRDPQALSRTFYKGGYSLRRHAVGRVSGFQVEASKAIREGKTETDAAARKEFVHKLANAVQYWVTKYNAVKDVFDEGF